VESNYSKSYKTERHYEGGNVDDPDDAGGRTSRGVTQRVYTAWRKRQGLQPQDVWHATDQEVASIFKDNYWNVIRGNDLAAGVDIVVFDGAINSGCSQSVKWLQRALGIKDDGQCGDVTIQHVKDNADHDQLIEDILAQRMVFLKHLKGWKKYRRGWSARVANVKEIGQAWASGHVGPAPVTLLSPAPKANAEDAIETAASPQTSIAVTTVSGAATGFVSQLQDAVAPLSAYADTFAFVRYITLGVTLISFGYTVYSIWKNNKVREAVA